MCIRDSLSTDFKADTAWGLRMNYESRWLNPLGGEFDTTVQLGRPNLFSASFYQPLDKSQLLFISPSVSALQTLIYMYQGNIAAVQLDTRRYGATLEGGLALGTWGQFRAGVLRGNVNISTEVGTPLPGDPTGSYALGAFTTRFVLDTLDRRVFPTDGSYGRLTGYFSNTGLGAASSYKTVALDWATTFTTGQRNVWTLAAHGGSDLDSHAPYYDQFYQGGLFNFSGYQLNQLVGREYALGTLEYRRAVTYLMETFGSAVYAGGSFEAGNVYERLDGTSATGVLLSGAVFLGVSSKLGPVYLAYGYSEKGQSALYLYLGSSFELKH